MKKKSTKRSQVSPKQVRTRLDSKRTASDDIKSHYDFDYAKARPNRFAARLAKGATVAVVLEPDVANVFRSAEAVNRFLRSAIAAMPTPGTSNKKRAS
jgi:hypothetical protein